MERRFRVHKLNRYLHNSDDYVALIDLGTHVHAFESFKFVEDDLLMMKLEGSSRDKFYVFNLDLD